jgi:hypothetical protein
LGFSLHAHIPWMMGAPVPAWLALAFFSFRLSHPDNFVFARWNLCTPEASASDLLLQVCNNCWLPAVVCQNCWL